MSVYAPCTVAGCGGQLVVGLFDATRVKVADPETGELVETEVLTPRHRADFPDSPFRPTGVFGGWRDENGAARGPKGELLEEPT